MSSETPNILTPYQQAMLTEMGISLWRQRSDSQVRPDMTVPSPETTIPAGHESADNRPEPNSVILPRQAENSRLAVDVLRALDLDEETVVYQDDAPEAAEVVFRWTFGEKLTFTDNKLVTPGLSELNSPRNKKKLWQLFCQP